MDCQAVPEQQVVRGGERARRIDAPGGVRAGSVPEECRAPGLVEGAPQLDPVAEPPGDDPGVVGEPVGGVAIDPAAGVFQSLRQVPVVERRDGQDVAFEQLIDEAVVEGDADRVSRAGAVRLHPGPGNREAVCRKPDLGHQADVLPVAFVVVRGMVAGLPRHGPARGGAECVPDGRGAAVYRRGALDLVRRGRCAPPESCRKLQLTVVFRGG
jgi:hypothetical protein